MADSAKESKVSVDMEKAPAKASPVSRIEDFETDIERLFDNFMSRGWLRGFRDFPSPRLGLELPKAPRVDVVERDNEIAIRAELPGVDKKDVQVSLTDRTITIRASTRKEEKEEKGEYFRREISTGEASRTLRLPAAVDGQKAKAEFKDGILEIVVPKIEKAKRVDVEVK
jgi:HSP20 family protein